MKRVLLTILLTGTLCLSTLPLFAWGDWGHMTVADIAYSRLNAHAKAEVDALLKIEVPPTTKKVKGKSYPIDPNRTDTFVTAACWPDDIKSNSDRTWHYIDIPYVLDDLSEPNSNSKGSDIVEQLTVCVQTLKKKNAPKVEKAKRLRYLIHFVGDIHQPLHCAELISNKHPHGDAGGNGFTIKGDEDNLHSLWDHGVGLFPKSRPKRPLSAANKTKVDAFADTCVQAYPEAGMGTEPTNFKFADWATDTHELAVSKAYDTKEGAEPKDTYVNEGQDTVKRQVALAGYRLANLLNEIWK